MSLDYTTVFQASPVPATLVDAEGVIFDVNDAFLAFARRHGVDVRREDRIGRHIADFAGDDDPDLGRAALARVFAGRDPEPQLRAEHTITGREGLHRLEITVLRNAAGQPDGALITREEVTDVVRQGERLEESSRLLNAFRTVGTLVLSSLDLAVILETMAREIVRAGAFRSLLVALVDHDAGLVEVQRSFVCKVDDKGWPIPDSEITSTETEIGRRIALEADDPAARVARTGELEVLEMSEPSGRPKVSYFIPVKKGDLVLAVLATASPLLQRDEILGRIDIMRPLLDQVAVAIEHARLFQETQRDEQEARVRLAVQRVRSEILLMENDSGWSRIVHALRRELRAFVRYNGCGINLVHADGHVHSYSSGLGLSATLDDPQLPQPLSRALETGRPVYRRNQQQMAAAGDRGNLAAAGIQSVVDVPFVTGTIAMNSFEADAFDPTDIAVLVQFAVVMGEGHRRLEDLRALAAKERQLQEAQKMEAVGQLTAGIAHNFNNMLQAITGNIDLARTEVPPGALRLLDNALETGHRAAEMVRQLMVYTRQGQQLALRSIDLAVVFRDVEAICERTFDRKIRLAMEVGPEPPPVVGDGMQLEQVLLNLCINARDALEQGNVEDPLITLACEAVVVSESAAPDARPGRYVRVRVEDNGPGMDENTRKRIFEPFFTTKDVGKGTGLGLSTALGIVQDHRGWIECDSGPAQGARFSLYLPVAEAAAPPIEEPRTASDSRGTETVLIVDDEEMVRSTAEQMLRRRGYTTLCATDGEEGLALYKRHRDAIDVILLDHSMPRMSGREALRQLRAESPDVAIVIITGFPTDLGEFEGADELLRKPFSLEALTGCVRSVLDDNP